MRGQGRGGGVEEGQEVGWGTGGKGGGGGEAALF